MPLQGSDNKVKNNQSFLNNMLHEYVEQAFIVSK